jgi:hypothetical protein
MYQPYLTRFIQADTIIPSIANPQTWNRYAYVNNNPVKNNDPSGHCIENACIVEVIALIGLALSMSQVPSDVPHDCSRQSCGDPNVVVTGLTVTAAAPDIATLAGEGLMGLGKALSSPKIFATGKMVYDITTTAEVTATESSHPANGSLSNFEEKMVFGPRRKNKGSNRSISYPRRTGETGI